MRSQPISMHIVSQRQSIAFSFSCKFLGSNRISLRANWIRCGDKLHSDSQCDIENSEHIFRLLFIKCLI